MVSNLENAITQAKLKEAAAAPSDKGILNVQIANLQNALNEAKVDAANKDAAAKSATTTPATTTGGGGGKTTTPTTTTGGGGGKTTTPTTTGGGGGKTTTPTTTTGGGGGKTTTPTTTGDGTKPGTPPSPPPKSPKDYDKDWNHKIDRDTKVITKVKVINKNKVVVRDNDDGTTKQIIVAGNTNTCPTQTESVPLTGKINPKGIRLLADFDPCKISDGSVTLNIPNTQNIKLAVLSVDKNSNNKQGVLITPIKIQNLNNNQALFTVELDSKMTGENPINGKSNTLTNINGLALYNDGGNAIDLKSGSMAALTATLTR